MQGFGYTATLQAWRSVETDVCKGQSSATSDTQTASMNTYEKNGMDDVESKTAVTIYDALSELPTKT